MDVAMTEQGERKDAAERLRLPDAEVGERGRPQAAHARRIGVGAERVPGRRVGEAMPSVVETTARVVDALDERRVRVGARGQHHGREGEQETEGAHGYLGATIGDGVAESKRWRSQFNVERGRTSRPAPDR